MSRRLTRIAAGLAMLAGLLSAIVPAQARDTVYYYSIDPLHSVVVVTDQNRNVVERTYYAPYGQVLNRSLREGPGYTAHAEDPGTGLVYMQQRYYDPVAGRFLSADPVQANPSTGGNFNRYWYANDNPYRFTDPFGMYSCSGSKTNCTAVANYYKSAVKAMGNMDRGSSTYKATAAAVGYLGKPGQDNGVTVTVKSLPGNERGGAPKGGNIAIDVKKINTFGAVLRGTGRNSNKSTSEVQNAVGAGVLVHEATHENDYKNVGYPNSRESITKLEVKAYSTERAVGAALGMEEIGLSTQHEFDSAVQGSVNKFCSDPRNGCQ